MELSDIAVFVKVIQSGSFSEAARRLGAPKSTVSSKVSSLERRLGVTLLQRTTRKLHLTDEGDMFFQTCARALSEIESAEAIAAGGQKVPQGRVSVTVPNDSSKFLASFLKRFLAKYANIMVDLIVTNRYVDLIGEGVDIAIRAGTLKDSSLIAKRIATSRLALFASPDYIAEAGAPTHPKDLTDHRCILFSKMKSEWELSHGRQRAKIKVTSVVTADDIGALKELASQGIGITLLPTFICRNDVEGKRLVPILPGWFVSSSPISVVYTAQKFQHPKIKVFIEELVKAMVQTYGSNDTNT